MPKKIVSDEEDNESTNVKLSKYQKKRKKVATIPEEDYLLEENIPQADISSVNDHITMLSNFDDTNEQQQHLPYGDDFQELGLNDKTDRKRAKKEKRPKSKPPLPKKKGPLNLDKQCGVLILPDNIVCTRSLTCKIHSMGAKRAVEGRSQPFNDLLAAYQKKNTGRTAQVIGSASHQQIDKTNQQRSAATRAKLASATTTTATAATAALTTTTAPTNAVVEVDSDEETENVFLAIKQFQPIPLGQKRYYHVRRRRAYVRLRDILLDAITPKLSGSAAAISATDPPTAIGGEFTCL